ncbi:MAG: hypothetical protein ABSE73_17600 [Planctomycetota bacterium]
MVGRLNAVPNQSMRPADAKSVLTHSRDCLTVTLPRAGFRGAGCGFTFFALVWNASTWSIVIMAMREAFSGKTPQGNADIQMGSAFAVGLMIPFILVGLATAVGALYGVFGQVILVMDRERGILRRALFGCKWDKKFRMAEVTGVQIADPYEQRGRPGYAVCISLQGRYNPVFFGSGLSEAEKRWLVGEIHAFWKEMGGNCDEHPAKMM